MDLFTTPFSHPSIGITLVSATDSTDANRIARESSNHPDVAVVDRPGADGGELAVELADDIAREADDGRTGPFVVALDPATDVMETALVLEHICDRRHPGDTTIGIVDVVAVSSVEEILTTLCAPTSAIADGTDGTDLGAAERLACRLEFASAIVLTDHPRSIPSGDRMLALDLLRRLAPTATIRFESEPSRHRVRPTPSHRRAHRLAASLGWQTELVDTSAVRIEPSGIGSFVFRDPRPFHPERLDHAVSTDLVPRRVGRIIRSRGLVRLASRPHRVGSWSIAGDVLSLDPTGMTSWDEDSPIGQEIVFFGLNLDHEALTEILGACLLTPEEFAAGPLGWTGIRDPFPQWTGDHEQSGEHHH